MISLYFTDNELSVPLAENSKLTFLIRNNLFDFDKIEGSYTFNLKIPFNKISKEVFGFVDAADSNTNLNINYSCIMLINGNQYKEGFFKVENTENQHYIGFFKTDTGILSSISSNKLEDLFEDDLVFDRLVLANEVDFLGSDLHPDLSEYIPAGYGNLPQGDYVDYCFPFIAFKNGVINWLYGIRFSPVPSFGLLSILSGVARVLNYTLEVNSLFYDLLAKVCFINKEACLRPKREQVTALTFLVFRYYMPDMTLADFLKDLKRMGIIVTLDEFNRKVRVTTIGDVFLHDVSESKDWSKKAINNFILDRIDFRGFAFTLPHEFDAVEEYAGNEVDTLEDLPDPEQEDEGVLYLVRNEGRYYRVTNVYDTLEYSEVENPLDFVPPENEPIVNQWVFAGYPEDTKEVGSNVKSVDCGFSVLQNTSEVMLDGFKAQVTEPDPGGGTRLYFNLINNPAYIQDAETDLYHRPRYRGPVTFYHGKQLEFYQIAEKDILRVKTNLGTNLFGALTSMSYIDDRAWKSNSNPFKGGFQYSNGSYVRFFDEDGDLMPQKYPIIGQSANEGLGNFYIVIDADLNDINFDPADPSYNLYIPLDLMPEIKDGGTGMFLYHGERGGRYFTYPFASPSNYDIFGQRLGEETLRLEGDDGLLNTVWKPVIEWAQRHKKGRQSFVLRLEDLQKFDGTKRIYVRGTEFLVEELQVEMDMEGNLSAAKAKVWKV